MSRLLGPPGLHIESMIRYEPHPQWIPDIVRLPVSYALRRALYGTLGMGVYATVLVWLLRTRVSVPMPHGAMAFSILGGVMTLALAFRVNNAYARWWEGRLHWGLLVNHCRNLAALTEALWPTADRAGRERMAGLIGDFAVGLSLHLRSELEAKDLATLTADERAIARRRAEGALDTAQVFQLEPHARALLDVLGACERIRATPIPFAVTAAVRLFLLLFVIFVPIGLHPELGWATVPVAMVAYFALAVMDVLASELENPFGIDCNDLPTRSIAEMIRRQVHEIVEVGWHGAPDTQPARPQLYEKIR